MAWTRRIVKIDKDTSEVLSDKRIYDEGWEKVSYQKIHHKITDTHHETVIIQEYRKSKQQRIDYK